MSPLGTKALSRGVFPLKRVMLKDTLGANERLERPRSTEYELVVVKSIPLNS